MVEKFKNIMCKLSCYSFLPLYNKLRNQLTAFAFWGLNHNIGVNYIFLFNLVISILGLNFLALEQFVNALLCLFIYRIMRLIALIMNSTKENNQQFFINSGDNIIFILYIMGFALANPQNNALGATFLLATLLINNTGIINLSSSVCELKHFKCQSMQKYLCFGLSKDNEIFVILLFMCFLPNFFLQFSIFFGLLSMIKALLLFASAFYDLEIKTKG